MNNRIKEIADKIWAEEYWTNPNTDKLLPAQLNKFAELIVRECSKVIRHGGQRKGAFGNEDLRPYEIATMIEEYFGVEERCPSCNYQHGHAIGCKNNPVDIALNNMAEKEHFGVDE